MFSLKAVGIVLGLALVAAHALAFFKAASVRALLARLPRSHAAGVGLLAVAFVWSWLLAYTMDWGEFYSFRLPALVLLPVMFYLVIRYVDEFLSARALGILGLLAAAPMLNAAFLQPPESRLLVVVLAYVWIVLGIIWVGQPYLMRDQIQWVSRTATRWQMMAGVGIAYGALLLVCALAFY